MRDTPLPEARSRHARHSRAALLALLLVATPARAEVTELVLGIEPLMNEAETVRQFTPLCRYLAQAAALPCRVVPQPSFFSYWQNVRAGQTYNLALDDAHFTDYRAHKMGFTVLARIPGTITYSLVVSSQSTLHDPAKLVGRRIATLGIPSMGAALLNGLFPKASKQPIPVEVDNAAEGFDLLREDKVAAAILPTPLIRHEMALGAPFRVLLSTEPIPHMALSASPELAPAVRDKLREALLNAHKHSDGQVMLRTLGIERFDPANATVYKGKSKILEEYWGY